MFRSRRSFLRSATPYLLLLPGLLWLVVFFAAPSLQMFLYSVSTGSVDTGYHVTWSFGAFERIPKEFGRQFTSASTSVIFLTLAAGSILYVVIQLLDVARKSGRKELLYWGVLLGLAAGFVTDMVVTAGGG